MLRQLLLVEKKYRASKMGDLFTRAYRAARSEEEASLVLQSVLDYDGITDYLVKNGA